MYIQLYDGKTESTKMMSAEQLVKKVGGKYGLRALRRLEAIGDTFEGDLPKNMSAHVAQWLASRDSEYPVVDAAKRCYDMSMKEGTEMGASISIRKNWKWKESSKPAVTCKIPLKRIVG